MKWNNKNQKLKSNLFFWILFSYDTYGSYYYCTYFLLTQQQQSKTSKRKEKKKHNKLRNFTHTHTYIYIYLHQIYSRKKKETKKYCRKSIEADKKIYIYLDNFIQCCGSTYLPRAPGVGMTTLRQLFSASSVLWVT